MLSKERWLIACAILWLSNEILKLQNILWLSSEILEFQIIEIMSKGAGSVSGQGGLIALKGHAGRQERIATITQMRHFAMFCYFFFVVINISTIKTSKIWCTFAPKWKKIVFFFNFILNSSLYVCSGCCVYLVNDQTFLAMRCGGFWPTYPPLEYTPGRVQAGVPAGWANTGQNMCNWLQ